MPLEKRWVLPFGGPLQEWAEGASFFFTEVTKLGVVVFPRNKQLFNLKEDHQWLKVKINLTKF